MVAAAAAATCAVIRRLRGTPVADAPTADSARTTGPGIGWLLGGWLVAILLLLSLEHPLWRPHVAHLVPPLALLAAWRRPSWRVLAIVLVPALAYHVVHTTEILWPDDATGDEAAVVAELQSLPEGALVISDDPGLAWRAGHGTPPDLVDTSILRIESGRITSESLADAVADDSQVCAVVVWSAVRFGSFEELPALLEDEGFDVAARYDDSRVLYVRPDCDPGSQG